MSIGIGEQKRRGHRRRKITGDIMDQTIVQKIHRSKWVRVLTVFILLWFIYMLLQNIRYVTVTTSTRSQVAISHSLDERQEIDEESPTQTTHTKLLWGYPIHVLAQDDFSIARTTRESQLLSLNPFLSINLDLKKQVQSQKITSNGDQCVLYNNNRSKTLVTSDCSTNTNNRLYKISYGVDKKQILDNLSILQATPYRGGFIYVSTLRESVNKQYELAFYNPEADSVDVIETDLTKRPHIVTDDDTGYGTGVLIGSQYHSIGARRILSKALFTISDITDDMTFNDGLLLRSHKDKLAVFTGNSPYQSSEESENARELDTQTLSLYSDSGKVLIKERVPKDLLVYFIAPTDSRVYITAKYPGGATTLMAVKDGSVDDIKGWGTADTTSGSLVMNERLYYVDSGRVWEYDHKLDSSHLVYSADKTFVIGINRVGSTIYISARSNQTGFVGTVFMYELDVTKSAANRVRIESVLPVINWSDNLLFADVYLDNIIVNYQNNSTVDPLGVALKNIGVNTQGYAIRVNDSQYFTKSSDQAGSTSADTPLESSEHTEDDYFTGDGVPPELQ